MVVRYDVIGSKECISFVWNVIPWEVIWNDLPYGSAFEQIVQVFQKVVLQIRGFHHVFDQFWWSNISQILRSK